jgi:hypothetical protein
MSTIIEDPSKPTTASLVTGILGDVQRLVAQQFLLTRREITDELRLRAAAGAIFGAGIGAIGLGLVSLTLAVVHVLHWATSPPNTDAASLPLWACYAVVAAVLVVIGGILAQVGKSRFMAVKSFHSPTEIFEEPRPWMTHPR